MQILHWLLKVAHEKGRESTPTSTIKDNIKAGEARRQDIVSCKKPGSRNKTERANGKKLGSKHSLPFAFLCRKDVAEACFYTTLNLGRVNSCNDRNRKRGRAVSRKMKREDIGSNKVDSASHAGNKVLPVGENAVPSTTSSGDQSGALEKKEQRVKGDKTKTLSRMKELLRWAAAAKTDKGGKFIGRKVLQFRSRAALKAVTDDEKFSSDSPKISFNWEVESCSTISSTYSSISLASSCKNDQHTIKGSVALALVPPRDRKGNWITTDTEFVVLEL